MYSPNTCYILGPQMVTLYRLPQALCTDAVFAPHSYFTTFTSFRAPNVYSSASNATRVYNGDVAMEPLLTFLGSGKASEIGSREIDLDQVIGTANEIGSYFDLESEKQNVNDLLAV